MQLFSSLASKHARTLPFGFPCIGKRRDPIHGFIYLADDFKAFQAFQLSLHVWSHWLLGTSVGGVWLASASGLSVIWYFPVKRPIPSNAVWKLSLKVCCVLDEWKLLLWGCRLIVYLLPLRGGCLEVYCTVHCHHSQSLWWWEAQDCRSLCVGNIPPGT